MKIVLDTNVFISDIFFGGPPSQILQSWRQSKTRIVLTEQILTEYQRIGEELSAKYPSVNIKQIIKLIVSGDKHLLNISGYKNIEVLKPREFVDTYLEE